MKTRIIVAAVLLPLLLIVLLALPAVCTAVLVGLMCAVAAYELLWGTGLVRLIRLVTYSAVMAFCTALWCYFGMSYPAAVLGILIYTAVMLAEVLAAKGQLPFEMVAVCFYGALLIPLLLSALVRIITLEEGRFFVLLPFLLAFTSDSGAYFAGKFLGKHKLAPVISPNKTVEGVAGGVAGAIVGMLIYCLVLDLGFRFRVNYLFALTYGILGSLAAVFGDLSFSAIKRQVGIKDYGNLIPGHGGVLDRFDSMTVVAPLTEALLFLIPFAVR